MSWYYVCVCVYILYKALKKLLRGKSFTASPVFPSCCTIFAPSSSSLLSTYISSGGMGWGVHNTGFFFLCKFSVIYILFSSYSFTHYSFHSLTPFFQIAYIISQLCRSCSFVSAPVISVVGLTEEVVMRGGSLYAVIAHYFNSSSPSYCLSFSHYFHPTDPPQQCPVSVFEPNLVWPFCILLQLHWVLVFLAELTCQMCPPPKHVPLDLFSYD